LETLKKVSKFGDEWYPQVLLWHHIDAIQELVTLERELKPLKIMRHHVDGHADDGKKWEDLKRFEQVNVLCDREATKSLYGQVKRHALPFHPLPTTVCYLVHKGKFQTSHEEKTLLWARPNTAAQKYYRKKYRWGHNTYDTINWPALSKSIQKQLNRGHFTPKLLCSWLPTLSVLHQREEIAALCPLCNRIEDNDHVFQCDERFAMHCKFRQSLQAHLTNTHTSPSLHTAIISGLDRYMNTPEVGVSPDPSSSSEPEEDITDNPFYDSDATTSKADAETARLKEIDTLIYYQTRLGWQHIFRGITPTEWSKHQAQYKNTTAKATKDMSPRDEWGPKLTKFLLNKAHESWVYRCDQVHHQTARKESAQNRRRAEALVRAAYRHKFNVGSSDREVFFGVSLEQRLADTGAAQLLVWYDTIQASLKQAIKDFERNSTIGQTTLLQSKFASLQEKLRFKPKAAVKKRTKGPNQPRQHIANRRRRLKQRRQAFRQHTIKQYFTTTKQEDNNPNKQADDNHPT
jgi:hypothetical protein